MVQDWWKDGQTPPKVKNAVEEVLNDDLSEKNYNRLMFKEKCKNVFDLIVNFAVYGKKLVV